MSYRTQLTIKMLFLHILLIALVPVTYQQCLTFNEGISPSQDDLQGLVRGQHAFSINMFNTVNAQNQGSRNIFFSPYSVYQALLLAYFSSGTQTEASLKRILNIPEGQEKTLTMKAYSVQRFRRQRSPAANYELRLANRLFPALEQRVRECMLQIFAGELEKLDYATNPDAAARRINSWVANITKNNILDLIPEGRLSADTQLVLANAAYFKGFWKSKFLAENSKQDVFYVNSSTKVLVTMMKQKGTFNHMVSEDLGAHILELPYKGDEVSMFLLLPPYASPNGITNLLSRLNSEIFRQILSEGIMLPRTVEVKLPKFSLEKETELIPILDGMGVGDLFTEQADLSGLTSTPGVHLNDAVHKAKIQVDEEGTVAAAATALFTFRSSRPLDPAEFFCNHPFVYLIYDKMDQNVLFTGVYNSPPQNGDSA